MVVKLVKVIFQRYFRLLHETAALTVKADFLTSVLVQSSWSVSQSSERVKHGPECQRSKDEIWESNFPTMAWLDQYLWLLPCITQTGEAYQLDPIESSSECYNNHRWWISGPAGKWNRGASEGSQKHVHIWHLPNPEWKSASTIFFLQVRGKLLILYNKPDVVSQQDFPCLNVRISYQARCHLSLYILSQLQVWSFQLCSEGQWNYRCDMITYKVSGKTQTCIRYRARSISIYFGPCFYQLTNMHYLLFFEFCFGLH